MKFFQTSDGAVHAGRIAGVLYLVSILVSCGHGFTGYCLSSVLFTLGWWMAFGGKEAIRTPYSSRQIGGLAVIAAGLAGMFYYR